MSDPKKPDRRLPTPESPKEPAASRETSRPADSVPVLSGQFANFPATFGRYQVERLLGRGAMGAVYLARDTQLDRHVALKIPKVTASGSKKLLVRLETEAKAAAQLDHPSLCKVHDAGEINGQCFIAMQYIEGETLKDQIEVKSKTVAEAVSLILQLAEGLSEAHALGIIHRDLKPENIMINRRGMPVIMDFGLAKFSTISSNAKATQAGTILGSPAYMSPEQASGNVREIDQRSDLYALGTILFELLTGQLPFNGSAMQILGQKSILEAASPLSLKPDLSPRLAAICHKMITRKSADRYQTLAEVIADLRGVDLSLALPVIDTPSVEANPFSNLVVSAPPIERTAKTAKRQQTPPVQRARDSNRTHKTRFQQFAAWWHGQSQLMKWTSLGGAAFLVLCGAIVITIKIKIKDGSQIEVAISDTSPNARSTHSRKRSKVAPEPAKQVPGLTPRDSPKVAGEQKEWVPGMKFRWCPAGNFTMGTVGATDNESPVEVRLSSGFWLGETEVTRGQWELLMNTAPRTGPAEVKEGPEFAASFVSHGDATTYCDRLTERERQSGRLPVGWIYTLPTEAQWEYACRAGTQTQYNFGDDESGLGQYAWYDKNALDVGEGYPHEVGKKKANAWGLRDMHGNVWEWCSDWYGEKLTGGPDPVGKSNGSFRVLRGGSWSNWASLARSAYRIWDSPRIQRAYLGLRVALVHQGPAVAQGDTTGTGPITEKNEPAPVDPATNLTETQPAQATSTASPLVSATKAGQEWSANGPRIHFCWCPPGKFTMGSARSEPGRLADEDPLNVTLSRGFWLGKTEVTRGQWLTVMGSEPRNGTPLVGQSELHPVQGVVRGDQRAGPLDKNIAMEFCERLTEQERTAGRLPDEWRYDLPTEAQWEYACRAGTKSAYSFANNSSRLNEYAWWGASVGNGDVKTGPRPVGGKRANSWGLHDMHGNVWELCSDRYTDNRKWYSKESDPTGPQSGDYWVVRGGSWFTNAEGCRSASRKPGENGQVAESLIGFRVALVSAGPSVDPSAATNTGKNRPVPVLPSAKPALAHSEAAPPKGFVALFNGKDLAGWRGGTTEHPLIRQALTPEERVSKDKASIADIHKHWRVENGELINDGTGLFLTTAKDYGDFELRLEYKTVAKADSGIYLRGFPQVQIWDSTKAGGKFDRQADKGSGGLYNNPEGSPGQLPLVLADKPFGEWNSFRITMIGDRVSVTLNDKLVVDNATLHNYFAKDQPLLSAGPIQLQTHGGEIRWRNVFLREIN